MFAVIGLKFLMTKYNAKNLLVLHKSCFKCAICDIQLKPGSCSRDDGMMYRQFMCDKRSPLWFCSTHMMLGSGEKCQMLREKIG
uniref:Uncharacterized protein n=1 Tax=Meloidogyne enterolobii TaxID=390850 RepID=A0A6V7V0S1_MELEN|nr:unnamed protein product [Meloidogyne enterolobii]